MKKRVIIILLVTIEICFLFLLTKSFSNKTIDEVKETYETNKKHFSMFIENEESTNYVEYTSSNIFPIGYVLNNDKSSCVGTNGQKLEGILSSSENGVTVTSNKTAYCYLYFDRPNLYELCGTEESIDDCSKDKDLGIVKTMWDSTLEDDGYRYVGTNPDNYICFGTTDQEECMNDTDKYMYRIIGIFEDEEGQQHLKLIKKEALNSKYAWHSDETTNTDWDESDLYEGINGEYFATNSEYSYMQDSAWTNKIEEWEYTATNTKTYENYNMNNMYGLYYAFNTSKVVYLHEMNRSNKSSVTCYYNSSTTTDCNIGEWKSIKGKISLMYISDYLLSLGSGVPNDSISNNEVTLKTGWMHISNNDSGAPSQDEWTSTYRGTNINGLYGVWRVGSSGGIGNDLVSYKNDSTRPVFYLESDTKLDKGNGTIEDPYIIQTSPNLREYCEEYNNINECIQNEENNIEKISDLWNSTLEDDGIRYVGTNPNNYVCFGTTNMSECISDTDKYMYRIIGIFEDDSGNNHLKLIKKEALNTAYQWHNNVAVNINWEDSDLYKGINGSYFLINTTYNYMQNNTWLNKITDWNYIATNTLSDENYIKYGTSKGVYYHDYNPDKVYLHELNKSSKESDIGEWITVSAKIGLMYVSDYLLSLGTPALEYISWIDDAKLKKGWIHMSNCDTNPAESWEWTMSRYGMTSDYGYPQWYVNGDNGGVHWLYGTFTISARPVFYLIENIKITSGQGSITEPFIIS